MNKIFMIIALCVLSLTSFQASASCKLSFLVNGSISEFSIPHKYCSHTHD